MFIVLEFHQKKRGSETFIPNERSVPKSILMAKQKYSKEELITNLFEVFRQSGYDGASMEALAKATGLRKSSLYHRFPRGKEQMAEEVLQTVSRWIRTHIIEVVRLPIPNEEKLDRVMKHLHELYAGGEKSCILRSMSTNHCQHFIKTSSLVFSLVQITLLDMHICE